MDRGASGRRQQPARSHVVVGPVVPLVDDRVGRHGARPSRGPSRSQEVRPPALNQAAGPESGPNWAGATLTVVDSGSEPTSDPSPTQTRYVPPATTHFPPPVSHMARSPGVRVNETVRDCPGCRLTLANPRSCRAGSP